MSAVVDILAKVHKGIILAEKAIVIALLFSMIVLAFGQVVARNFFSTGWMAVDEITRIQVLWLTFLGAGLAAEYNRHVKIDVLSHLLGGGAAAKVIDTCAQIFAMAVCLALCYASIVYIGVERQYDSSVLFHGIPDWVFRLVFPYFFGAMAIRCVINIRRIFLGTHTRSLEP